ncbi:carbamoylsarcosine amidase [Candidatus Formimonas warabiya]|uniref:Carbamoylsarcosine amidase n=2 Tax=Formimonas warabiya TaxID=1761012 RepID=A0A3G1KWF0_FORW1|nr:carbamoylsarcosine amidase [Candidatus Formimonas warabiya]
MKQDDLQQIYQRAQLGYRIGFGEMPAVVVVDFCKGFTDPSYPLGGDFSKELAATVKLLKLARSKNMPVVFTTVGYQAHLKDDGIWSKKITSHKHLMLNSEFIEIDGRLSVDPEYDTVLIKKGASAFFGTNLISILISQGVDTVIVAGVTTSGCVRATVVDACQFGFRTIVPADCVGDRAEAPHLANLFDIDSKYSDVMSLNEVLERLAAY